MQVKEEYTELGGGGSNSDAVRWPPKTSSVLEGVIRLEVRVDSR